MSGIKELPWSNAHGRLREAVRVVRSMATVSPGAFRCFDAIAQGINIGTGGFICRDEVMAVLIGVQSRQSVYRYRRELMAEGLIQVLVGRLGEATTYRIALTDADILTGLDQLKNRKAAARDRAADDEPRRARVTEPLHERRFESAGEAAIDDAPDQICYVAVQQKRYAILPSHTPSKITDVELYDSEEKFSSRDKKVSQSKEINPEPSRQAESEENKKEMAVARLFADPLAVQILGDGSVETMLRRLSLPWLQSDLAERLVQFQSASDWEEMLGHGRDVLDDAAKRLADLCSALGQGDSDLGEHRASQLEPRLLGFLIEQIAEAGLVGAADDISTAVEAAKNAVSQELSFGRTRRRR